MRSGAPGPAPMKCTVIGLLRWRWRRACGRGSPPRPRSCLPRTPLADRRGRSPDEDAACACPAGLCDFQAHELAAMALEEPDQLRFGLQRYGIGDQAAAGFERRPGGLEHAGIGEAAADEDGVGTR